MMTKLTKASYVKITLVVLLCVIVCSGFFFCSTAPAHLGNAMGGIAESQRTGEVPPLSSFAEATPVSDTYVDADDLDELSVNWAAGTVEIRPFNADEIAAGQGAKIRVIEYAGVGMARPTSASIAKDGSRLGIGYGTIFPLGGCSVSGKHLKVLLPISFAENIDRFELHGSSGLYRVSDLDCQSCDMDLASGRMNVHNVSAQALSTHISSGEADISGDYPGKLDLSVSSGTMRVESTGDIFPKQTDLGVASGHVELLLPESEGFTAEVFKASGSFTCGYPCQQMDDIYICGDGSKKMDISIASGEVVLASTGKVAPLGVPDDPTLDGVTEEVPESDRAIEEDADGAEADILGAQNETSVQNGSFYCPSGICTDPSADCPYGYDHFDHYYGHSNGHSNGSGNGYGSGSGSGSGAATGAGSGYGYGHHAETHH